MIERAVISVGFENVSTTAVARRLGVEQSSLYRHIRSRRDLLLGALRRVVIDTDFRINAPDWRQYVHQVATRAWNMLVTHPGMAGVYFELDCPYAEHTTPVAKLIVDRLVEFGFTRTQALMIVDTVADITCAAVHRMEEHSDTGDRPLALTPQPGAEKMYSTFEQTQREYARLRPEPNTWWKARLEMLLDGAEKALKENEHSNNPES